MKLALALVVCGALFVAIAAGQKNPAPKSGGYEINVPPPGPPPAVASGTTVKDVRIELALFGSGTHLVDVTDRAVELLRTQPQGFEARADWLKIDPMPGKNKSLLIRYRYHNQERYFMVTGGNRASYSALVEEQTDKEPPADGGN